jgi:hypothetical protein
MRLHDALRRAAPDRFLVEAEFGIEPTFESEQGIAGYRAQFNLAYARVRPDLIEVLPPAHFSRYVTPAGEVEDLPALDARLQLRVIDIKLTAEPSPSYFAEVTYYTIALACWLVEHRLDHQFVVVPDGAVWPGSHAASHLAVTHRTLAAQGITPSSLQLREALEEDLEQVPYEVFAFRLRHFLQEDLREVLSTSSWQTLAWHVDNRCKGCEYLGSSWHNAQGQFTNHPDHCMPMA